MPLFAVQSSALHPRPDVTTKPSVFILLFSAECKDVHISYMYKRIIAIRTMHRLLFTFVLFALAVANPSVSGCEITCNSQGNCDIDCTTQSNGHDSGVLHRQTGGRVRRLANE